MRRSIGVVAQRSGVDVELTGRENVMLQGRLQGLRGRDLARRADTLLAEFGLADAARRIAKGYSGGMQRRLDIAMGLVHRPKVLFLDEPTTGLDPEVRAAMWTEISRLKEEQGLTILLTTHYLEEADRLASALAIVDRGRVVAQGAPGRAEGRASRATPCTSSSATSRVNGNVASALARVGGLREVQVDGRSLHARADDGARAVPAVLAALDSHAIGVASVTVARPSLDDVYLRFAGRSFAAAEASDTHEGAGPMTAVADTFALTIRDLLRLVRQPWFIAIVLVQPIIWLLLFGALFERVTDIPGFEGGDYKQYLVPGVLVMTAFFSSGWNGMPTIDDLNRGVVDRLLVTPVKRMPLIGGRVLQNLVQLVLQSLVIVALALAIGVSFDGGVAGVVVLVLAAGLLGTAFAALSNALALVTRQEESLIGAVTFLQLPLTFLSTAFMQPELMPGLDRARSPTYNPVDWAIRAGREAVGAGHGLGRRGRLLRPARRLRARLPAARDARVPVLPGAGVAEGSGRRARTSGGRAPCASRPRTRRTTPTACTGRRPRSRAGSWRSSPSRPSCCSGSPCSCSSGWRSTSCRSPARSSCSRRLPAARPARLPPVEDARRDARADPPPRARTAVLLRDRAVAGGDRLGVGVLAAARAARRRRLPPARRRRERRRAAAGSPTSTSGRASSRSPGCRSTTRCNGTCRWTTAAARASSCWLQGPDPAAARPGPPRRVAPSRAAGPGGAGGEPRRSRRRLDAAAWRPRPRRAGCGALTPACGVNPPQPRRRG